MWGKKSRNFSNVIIKRQNVIIWENYCGWWWYNVIKFTLTRSWWLLFCLHAADNTLGYCALHWNERANRKHSQNGLKCALFILFPLRWGELCQALVRNKGGASHQSMTQLHLSFLNPIMCDHLYSMPAQPTKHWLYTNKISHYYFFLINLVSLCSRSDFKCLSLIFQVTEGFTTT